jgi:hypothetical protein
MTSEYLDDRVLNEDRAEIEGHLRQCRACVEHFEVRRRLKSNLKRLPMRVAPARLNAALLTAAAVERSRVNRGGFDWRDRATLLFRNMMRPFAVPAMGGIVSAIVLFSIIMPSIAIKVRPMLHDVPTNLFTDASAKYFAPIGMSESELVFDLVVDSDGRVVDYTVVSGSELLLRDASLRRQVENNLLFTEFTPATLLGGRTSGRVRLQMKGDHINIRG